MSKENEFYRPVKIADFSGAKKISEHHIEADEAERAALALRFGIVGVDKLVADVTVTRAGDKIRYHVTGELTADVTQESVTTAEHVVDHIHETFDAWFADNAGVALFENARRRHAEDDNGGEIEMRDEKDDPESIIDGIIDIGEVTAQFLGLALNPYPHAQGETPRDYIESEEKKENPFAVLASLKTKE